MMQNSSEIKDLVISWIVMGLCYSYDLDLTNLILGLPIYLIAVGLSFFAHELMHRFAAQKLGYVARYKMWTWGLTLALISTILSGGRAIFSAPGAVYITYGSTYSWRDPKKDEVLISLVGPLANIVLAIIFYPLSLGEDIISITAYVGFAINSSLAFFNLLPIPPLDGSKIFRGNMLVWAGLMIASAYLFFFF
jgi:Zn-dependent protease